MNTSEIGSTAIFTYTAKPDGAGNLGSSVTRNVTVVEYNLLNITSLTTSSNNPINSSYAKAGDNVTITIETDGIIETITGNILGDGNYTKSISSSLSTSTLTLTKTITQSDTNGNLTFNILAPASGSYAVRATHEDLTTNNIIIDTISPIITLNGTNNTVSVLNYPYADANATAYDASYGSINIPPTGTVDIDNVGNNTLYYTAPSDPAGNTAPTITRNVIVLDLPPLSLVESFTVSPAGTLVNSTTIDNPDHIATFQIGTATYAGISSTKGLTIMNITDIGSPTHVSRYNGAPVSGISTTLQPSFTAFVSIDGSTYALSEHGRYLVILKANNLVSFSPIKLLEDGEDDFTALNGITSVTTTTIGSSTYALVTAANDNGVQIINITTPSNPIAASKVTNGTNYPNMLGPISITTTTIGSSTYALVVSNSGHRVHIIDITNPSQPSPTSVLLDNTDSLKLRYPRSVTTTTIDSSTYALVASQIDDAVSIVNITTPSTPIKASVVSDGSTYPNLNGAYSVTTTTIGSSTYALVAAQGDNGVQVIDITNPYTPTPASEATNNSNGFTKLTDARSIATTIDSSTYALVASTADDGIQIIQLTTPPQFNSNNPNPEYAKAGDTLTLRFTVNDTIVSSTTQFTNLNQTPSMTVTDTTYIAALTIPSDPIESNADFVITLENNQSVTLSVTENDFPSNIFVDTVSPRIELVGDANHTVFVNSNYVELGAVVSDGDPNYTPNYTITDSGYLNTSMVGSFTVYTYTAHPDAAGNLGENVIRNVTVVDYIPITVTSLIASSDNSVNGSYAKVGDEIRLTLTADAPIETVTGVVLGDDL